MTDLLCQNCGTPIEQINVDKTSGKGIWFFICPNPDCGNGYEIMENKKEYRIPWP